MLPSMSEIAVCPDYLASGKCTKLDCHLRHSLTSHETRIKQNKEQIIKKKNEREQKVNEIDRIRKLCAFGKDWQAACVEILKIFRLAADARMSDSLINIIISYHIVDYPDANRWGRTFPIMFDRWDENITPTDDMCDICLTPHHYYWVCISKTYIRFHDRENYTYRLICPMCINIELYMSARSSSSSCITITCDGRILDPCDLNCFINWDKPIAFKWDENYKFCPGNDVTLLRSLCIDRTCRLYPITKFEIRHPASRVITLSFHTYCVYA